MPAPGARPYEPLTARYGSIGESGEWKLAIDAYYRDEMPAAYAVAVRLGAGFGGAALRWYRMIEGEALTRERATVESLEPWLSLEHDPHEWRPDEAHRDALRSACAGVAERLGWDFALPVRATVLLAEVDAPWHGARAGYCVDKVPYDKVCLPLRAVQEPESLKRVMAHEFTHVVNLNLTQARIPHWLDEGLAMLMEGDAPQGSGWLDPEPLNAAFEEDRRTDEGLRHSQDAYAQAAVLVRRLHRLQGDAGLQSLLRAFTNNSAWSEIRIGLLGQSGADEALREVYGLGEGELFAQAKG